MSSENDIGLPTKSRYISWSTSKCLQGVYVV